MAPKKKQSVYEVGGMSHQEMRQIVTRRLNALAMCKRGTIETEINKKIEALGNKPEYTKDERAAIDKKLSSDIKKAATVTIADIKKALDDSRGSEYVHDTLSRIVATRIQKVTKDRHIHPDLKKWTEDKKRLRSQADTRIALLDADFATVEDAYTLGLKTIDMLPQDLLDLEEKSW